MTVHRFSHKSSQHITAVALFQSIYLSNSIKRQLCHVSTPSVERKRLIKQNLAYSNRSSRGTAPQPVRNTLPPPHIVPQLYLWSVPLSASPKTCTVSWTSRKRLSTSRKSRRDQWLLKEMLLPQQGLQAKTLLPSHSYHSPHTKGRVSKDEDLWIIQNQTVPSPVNSPAAAAKIKHWLVFRPQKVQKAQAVRQKECIHLLFLNQVKQRQFVRQALMEKLI